MEFKHLDAAENYFFSRQLESIKQQTFDIVYPDKMGRFYVPVSNDANPGAQNVTYRQYDAVGRAKIVAERARDIPNIEMTGLEFTRPVRTVGALFEYTVVELRGAAMANIPLGTLKAMRCREAIEEELDSIAALGDATFGIADGLLNSAAVPQQSVPNGASAAPEWNTKTADEIIADISAAISRVRAATLDTQRPNTIILPPAQHALISTTPRAATSDTTIYEFVLRSFPDITTIGSWYRLTGAGVGPSDRMVVYRRDPMVLTQDIASEFEMLAPQEDGLNIQVVCMARTAGTALYYPLAADYSDDI